MSPGTIAIVKLSDVMGEGGLAGSLFLDIATTTTTTIIIA